MAIDISFSCPLLLSYARLSRKPILFKSFTCISVQEFDGIYNKEITKRYHDYEIKRLPKRKDRKGDTGAGRPFNLGVKDGFLMLLVCYRLYITYTLAGFLFDLDQSNVGRDIQKIESLIGQCIPIPQKIYNITKMLRTLDEVEQYFPGFLAFIDSTEQQQIPRPVDNKRRKVYYSGKKKKHTVKTQNGWSITRPSSSIIRYKKEKKRHDYDVYKNNHPITPIDVLNVFDLGYLDVEKDFSEQPCRSYRSERKEIWNYLKKKIEYNKSHSRRKKLVIEHTICRLKSIGYLQMYLEINGEDITYNKISDIVAAGLINYGVLNQ